VDRDVREVRQRLGEPVLVVLLDGDLERLLRPICSSISENMTIAPTPASAIDFTPSSVCCSGPADATIGLRSFNPR